MLRPLAIVHVHAWALCVLAAPACNGAPPDEGPRGMPCSADADCGELACAADLQAAAEDLVELPLACSDPREGGAAGEPCTSEEDCERGVCLLAGACALPCARSGDCGEGERCQQVFARRGTDALQRARACVHRTDLPETVTVEFERRRGALEPPASQVDLPAADAETSTLFVLEHSDDNWPDGFACRPALCVRALYTRDPAPVELFDAELDYARAAAPLNPVAIGDHLHPAMILLPAGDRAALSAAGYRADVAVEQPGDLLLTRLSFAEPTGGRLDLNAFYLGLDWTPVDDRGPPLLADALAIVDDILGQAGIFVGELRQIAVPGELPDVGTEFPPEGDPAQGFARLQERFGLYVELPGLFRLSAGAANTAINLFFVREIDALVPGAEPEAQAGGIPGPLGMHGTGSSGIAISTDMMAGNPEMLGRTLAHEIAHFLGLFHTSEIDGSVYEPLSDTPECRPEQDVAGDGLSVEDCGEHGADNLMFWAKTTGTRLTEQQRAVLRRAPVLQ